MADDDENVKKDASEDESMLRSRFSPTMNTSSKSVAKGKSKGKCRQLISQRMYCLLHRLSLPIP